VSALAWPFGITAQEAPPLPCLAIEGNGGLFSTYAAYLTNPAPAGEIFGLPKVSYTYVNLGHSRDINSFGITETLWNRLEFGYAYNRMDVGDLPEDLLGAGFAIDDDAVGLHNFNARLALLKEGEFDLPWLPAVTLGVHYKYNDTIDDINDDLKVPAVPQGVLRSIGIEDDDGVDFTLYATKLVPDLPRPLLFSLGLRCTEAAHIGLFGFTDDYNLMVEGSIFAFVTDSLLMGAEYRMKPDEYDEIPGLVEGEDDWWTICACYIVNEHMTISAGYGHFGDVLNHEANGSWAVRVNWEF
jgi:hypothetical protein